MIAQHFADAARALHTESNWVKYYELCRDAPASPSARVRENAETGLFSLVNSATLEQLEHLCNDPFLPENVADYANQLANWLRSGKERKKFIYGRY